MGNCLTFCNSCVIFLINQITMLEEETLISDFIKGICGNYIDNLVTKIVDFKGWEERFDKEDLFQNIRLALLKNFKEGKYRGEGLTTYVGRIAEIQCLMAIRRRYGREKHFEKLSESSSEEPDPQPGALDELLAKEKKDTAIKILMELDKRCRKVLIFKFYKGMSYDEISRRLTVTAGHAMVLVHRCLEKCQDLYQKIEKPL